MKRILLVLFLMIFLCGNCYASFTGSIVAWWKMNDNAATTTVVDSAGSNTGTFVDAGGDPNTNAHNTTGKINGALTFDGNDDKITIPAHPSIDLPSSELVTNGDFAAWSGAADPDNEPDDWFISGAIQVEPTHKLVDAGNKCQMIADFSAGKTIIMREEILTIGKEYSFSINITAGSAGGLRLFTASSIIAEIDTTVTTTTGTFIATSISFSITNKRSGGDTNITFTDVSVRQVKNQLSISAWINPASDGENHQGRIFDKGNSFSGYISWVSSEGGGKVAISFSVIMTGTNSLAVKTAALSINTWQHLVFTYNEDGDKKSKIFIDGLETSLSTDTAGTGSTTDDSGDDLYIGNRILTDSTFDGLIDSVMIFDKALSASEVKYLYNGGRGLEELGQRNPRSRYSGNYRTRYNIN